MNCHIVPAPFCLPPFPSYPPSYLVSISSTPSQAVEDSGNRFAVNDRSKGAVLGIAIVTIARPRKSTYYCMSPMPMVPSRPWHRSRAATGQEVLVVSFFGHRSYAGARSSCFCYLLQCNAAAQSRFGGISPRFTSRYCLLCLEARQKDRRVSAFLDDIAAALTYPGLSFSFIGRVRLLHPHRSGR